MDKKNTLTGALLIVAAIAVFIIGQRMAPPPHTSAAEDRRAAVQQGAVPQSGPTTLSASGPQPDYQTATADRREAKTLTLENGFIRVHFTDSGGAIRDVALKKYPAVEDRPEPVVLNELHVDPMLAFVDFPGLDRNTQFALVSQSANEVVFRAVLAGRLEVTRRYLIAPDEVGATDPYQLRSETTFRNLAAQPSAPMRVQFAVGTAAPLNLLDSGYALVTGYSTGPDQTFTRRSQLEPSNGLFGLGLGASVAKPLIERPDPIVWAATKNQFFASILTPDQPGVGFVTRRVKLLPLLPDDVRNAYGVSGAAEFNIPAIAAGSQTTFGANFYVGPTEYHRLANGDVFKADQDKVMQFGKYIGFFAAILLTLMTKIHTFVPNWGLAIICTTLTLRFAMLVFTIPAARSARRMQKIQPLLQAVKEKYKDNPQKQQSATLEIFKEHKVNPVGGCLPQLFTIPFFFGFFRMLQSAVELRFAPFLWAHDLSATDTVFAFGHGMLPLIGTFKLNILPLLFTATSLVQMRLVPQPSVDNAQARMMKFMPIFVLFIYYSYSCALSLYSTVNGLFMIGQQILVNRMRDDGDPARQKAGAGKKPVKNITPAKRR